MGEPAGELPPLQPATTEPPANPEPVVEPLAEPAAQLTRGSESGKFLVSGVFRSCNISCLL